MQKIRYVLSGLVFCWEKKNIHGSIVEKLQMDFLIIVIMYMVHKTLVYL